MTIEVLIEVDGVDVLVEDESMSTTIVAPSDQIEYIIGVQGPPGPSASIITMQAGATILTFQALVIIGSLIYPADPTNPAHAGPMVGIAVTSALSGQDVDFVISGEVANFPNNLVPGDEYYVGALGVLSTSPVAPGAVWKKFMGIAKSTSVLILEPDPTIEIA